MMTITELDVYDRFDFGSGEVVGFTGSRQTRDEDLFPGCLLA